MKYFTLYLPLLLVLSQASAQITHLNLDEKGSPNEPAVVISSKQKIYAAANVDRFYTIDVSNNSFANAEFTATSEFGVYGDPVLHYLDTTLFFTHLSKTPGKEYGDWFDRIVVQKIANVEQWDEKSFSVGYNQNKMQDKPWVSSDTHSNHKGSLYVTWTEFDKYDSDDLSDRSRIRFSKYTFQSDSFSEAITLSDTTGDCLDGDNTLEGATTSVGPNGELYAVWAGLDKIWFDFSLDGGLTWHQDVIIATQYKGWDMDMPNIMRANGMPFICTDHSNGNIYVCWADEKNGNGDIWLKYSIDKGQTWSNRVLVNRADVSPNTHQYFPNMTVDPSSGKVFIAYYDQQHSSLNKFYDVYLSIFDPAKNLTSDIMRVTKKSIPLPGESIFYGDYLDLDVKEEELAIIYTTYYSKKVAIELALGTVNDYKLSQAKSDPYALALDTYTNKDSILFYLNIQNPGKLKFKAKSGKGKSSTKKRIVRRLVTDDVNSDQLIASLPNKYLVQYKLKIKQKEGKKYIISSKEFGQSPTLITPNF